MRRLQQAYACWRPAASALPSHCLLQDEAGADQLLLFGGRREDGLLLNDVWQGQLANTSLEGGAGNWTVMWTLLHDPQGGTGAGACWLREPSGTCCRACCLSSLLGRLAPGSSRCPLCVPLPMHCAGPAPLPRSGHTAVMLNGSQMLLHGGRSEVYGSFADVWLFDLGTRRWSPQPPVGAAQPAPRDRHGAGFWGGDLFLFGGRFLGEAP